MRAANRRQLAKPLAWASGAIGTAAAWAFVSVYALGNADHAYGASGSLVLQLLMAGVLLVPGFAGCLVGHSVRSGFPSHFAALLAGAGFAIVLGLFLGALGQLSPGASQLAVPLTAAFLFGALSYAIAPANVA
jgi:hypothetical protein